MRARVIHFGASPDQLISTGFGQTRPVATNDTAQGRALNRRVELHVERKK